MRLLSPISFVGQCLVRHCCSLKHSQMHTVKLCVRSTEPARVLHREPSELSTFISFSAMYIRNRIISFHVDSGFNTVAVVALPEVFLKLCCSDLQCVRICMALSKMCSV